MDTLRTVVLLTTLTLGLAFIGHLIGGQHSAPFALVAAGILNMCSYWFFNKIVIKRYRGRQVTSCQFFKVVNKNP
jgi:heat shock protein HtpX